MTNKIVQPLKGATVALAVASLVGCGDSTTSTDATSAQAASSAPAASTASASSASSADLAHCYGANICKGHNDCKTANNACAGQGECKGQGGFVATPTKACADIGGEVRDDWRGEVASLSLIHI